jgi:hypothetical protein
MIRFPIVGLVSVWAVRAMGWLDPRNLGAVAVAPTKTPGKTEVPLTAIRGLLQQQPTA